MGERPVHQLGYALGVAVLGEVFGGGLEHTAGPALADPLSGALELEAARARGAAHPRQALPRCRIPRLSRNACAAPRSNSPSTSRPARMNACGCDPASKGLPPPP